jgi:hypothetical protein
MAEGSTFHEHSHSSVSARRLSSSNAERSRLISLSLACPVSSASLLRPLRLVASGPCLYPFDHPCLPFHVSLAAPSEPVAELGLGLMGPGTTIAQYQCQLVVAILTNKPSTGQGIHEGMAVDHRRRRCDEPRAGWRGCKKSSRTTESELTEQGGALAEACSPGRLGGTGPALRCQGAVALLSRRCTRTHRGTGCKSSCCGDMVRRSGGAG